MPIPIRPLAPDDRDRVAHFIRERWGTEMVVAHGSVYFPHNLPGFAALEGETIVGLVTYCITGEVCEIVTLDSLRPNGGLGTARRRYMQNTVRQSTGRLC